MPILNPMKPTTGKVRADPKFTPAQRREILSLLLAGQDQLDGQQKRLLADVMQHMSDDFIYNKLSYWEAYPRQREFFAAGLRHRERCLMAPNRVGKSDTGAAETAYHLTGLYPDNWTGRRWNRPTRGWAAGLTSIVTRDIMQKKLCGTPGVDEGPTGFGTGLIPKEKFVGRPSTQRGVADAFDMIQVKHVSGGISTLNFKSFEQGRAKFQGEALDFGWADEEGDIDVYIEFLFRMAATPTNPEGGILFTTYTPILGITPLTLRFTEEKSPERACVNMSLEDALHITKAERKILEANCPEHEKDARIYGRPGLGGGAVFPFASELYTEPAIEFVPRHWRVMWGIDFGIDHPFAAALCLYDPDNDVIHVHHSFKMEKLEGAIIKQHCAPILNLGAAVPVAWPHDGAKRDPRSGEAMSKLYKAEGLRMHETHSTWPEGGYSFEAGVFEMHERMGSGRLKIASHLSTLLKEVKNYRREDGQIVKLNDDELSAVRQCVMMKRIAQAVPLGSKRLARGGPNNGMARDVDFDPWNG